MNLSRLRLVPNNLSLQDETFFFLAAIFTALNDHLWKEIFHNSFTGKLSDILGPFVLFRLLLGPIRGFSMQAAGVISLTFCVALKCSQSLADAVGTLVKEIAWFNHSYIIADRNDLFAMIPFAVFVFLLMKNNWNSQSFTETAES